MLLLTWVARRQILGHAGDVLGATSAATEALLLSLLATTVPRS